MTRTTATTPAHKPPLRVLRIDSSARYSGSTTRDLTDQTLEKLAETYGAIEITTRDLSEGLPFVSEDWVNANFTDPEQRSEEQRARLALSDTLIEEVKEANILVIGAPVYNFGIPAVLKAWIDQIARARVTFRYTESGPVGLLEGKRAILVAASGGTAIGSAIDFATPYLRHVLGFVGIHDVQIIGAGQQMVDDEAASKAKADIANLAA